jgi:FkbM family methyltransferase
MPLIKRLYRSRVALPSGVLSAVWWLSRFVDPYATRSYSQEGEDMVVRRLFDGLAEGFYIDVGAHHPMRFSNTCYFCQRGWRGINIDPDPNAMVEFRRVRPGDINLTLGVSDEPGMLRYHVFNDSALNTFDETLAAERSRLAEYRLLSQWEVPVRRLDDILSSYLRQGQTIDLMSVDTEGYDLKVLRSNDWERFRPRCVLVEALKTSLQGLEENPIHEQMTTQGYELFAKTVNTMIYLDRRPERT